MTEILRGRYEDKRIVVWEGTLDDALRAKVQKRSKKFIATTFLPDVWEDAAMRESIRRVLDAGANVLTFVGIRSGHAENIADCIIVGENREKGSGTICTITIPNDHIDEALLHGLEGYFDGVRKSLYFIPERDQRLKHVLKYLRSNLDRIDYDARPVRKRAPRAE
ncbi:MAG: hypothetical protein ACYDHD_06720 [Vulcanimicrobiaceae bacterium]